MGFFFEFLARKEIFVHNGVWGNLGVKCGFWGLSGRISGVNGWTRCARFFVSHGTRGLEPWRKMHGLHGIFFLYYYLPQIF